MTCNKTHRTIDIRIADYDYLNNMRKTDAGILSYAEVFNTVMKYWKDNHDA